MIVEIYRDYEIYKESYGFTVQFCGDEVIHKSIDEAKSFIDEIWEHENDPDWWIG